MLMSQLNSVLQLYIFYGVLLGIGLSSIDVIALTTIARWFSLRRGAMTGLVKVGTGAGQFTIPLIASFLIGLVGWRHTYLIIGVAASPILFGVAQILNTSLSASTITIQPAVHAPPQVLVLALGQTDTGWPRLTASARARFMALVRSLDRADERAFCSVAR